MSSLPISKPAFIVGVDAAVQGMPRPEVLSLDSKYLVRRGQMRLSREPVDSIQGVKVS